MIIAVEVNENEWDFSCTNKFELDNVLELGWDKLKIIFLNCSKLSFRASLSDIKMLTKALSENGIWLYADKRKEVMMSLNDFAENDYKLPFAKSENAFEKLLSANTG